MINLSNPPAAAGPAVSLVGNKARGLWKLSLLGARVPPSWAVVDAHASIAAWPEGLCAVRASPTTSRPGQLPTVLWVGLVPSTREELARDVGDTAAWRAWVRHLVQWCGVTGGADGLARAQATRDAWMERRHASLEALDVPALRELAQHVETTHGTVPDAGTQRTMALAHVLSPGCAAVVQPMVHADRAGACGSGAATSRHPVTGAPGPAGEFLHGGIGADVMEGHRTPAPLTGKSSRGATLQDVAPAALAEIADVLARAEADLGAPVEIEFSVVDGVPWFLQLRAASLEPRALVRATVDRVNEGRLDVEHALAALASARVGDLVTWRVSTAPPSSNLARGVVACTGAVTGRAVFDVAAVLATRARGESAILVRPECNPEDRPGLEAAAGVFTTRGGTTSHAAVMSRVLRLPCVVAGHTLQVDMGTRTARGEGGVVLREHDLVTLDAHSGELHAGALPLEPLLAPPELATVIRWAMAAVSVKIEILDGDATSAPVAQLLGVSRVSADEVASRGLHVGLEAGGHVLLPPRDAIPWLLARAGTPG